MFHVMFFPSEIERHTQRKTTLCCIVLLGVVGPVQEDGGILVNHVVYFPLWWSDPPTQTMSNLSKKKHPTNETHRRGPTISWSKKPRSNHQQEVRIISFSCVVDLGRPWVGGDDDTFNLKKHNNHQSNVYAQIICSCVHCQNDWCNCIWNQKTLCCQNFLICVQTNCNSSVWVLGCQNSGFLLFWMVCIGDAPVPDFDIETEQLHFLNHICSKCDKSAGKHHPNDILFLPSFSIPNNSEY